MCTIEFTLNQSLNFFAKIMHFANLNSCVSGVSSYKQAFSIGTPNSLLARMRLCCCNDCITRNFEECKNKVVVLSSCLCTALSAADGQPSFSDHLVHCFLSQLILD